MQGFVLWCLPRGFFVVRWFVVGFWIRPRLVVIVAEDSFVYVRCCILVLLVVLRCG